MQDFGQICAKPKSSGLSQKADKGANHAAKSKIKEKNFAPPIKI